MAAAPKKRTRKAKPATEEPQPTVNRFRPFQPSSIHPHGVITRTDGNGKLSIESLPRDAEVLVFVANENKPEVQSAPPALIGEGLQRKTISLIYKTTLQT